MKKMNKILSVMMAAAMTVSMTACGGDTASDNTSASADNSAATTESAAAGSTDGQKYTIGILQQLEHPALDAASQGFEDALTELLGADNVTFDLQNAQGEQANCATIANNFVAGNKIICNGSTVCLLALCVLKVKCYIICTEQLCQCILKALGSSVKSRVL